MSQTVRRSLRALVVCSIASSALPLYAGPGDVFCKTPETVAIWEFNDLGIDPGLAIPDGTVIPDVSGNGLDAIVKDNGGGALVAGDGAPEFPGNTSVRKALLGGAPRIEVEDDTAFAFGPEDDFSFELYVRRDDVPGTVNWGILAGTWHSRTTLDDTVDPIAQGAWYGFGFIRDTDNGGWRFTTSPIAADGTFNPSFNEVYTAGFDIPAGSHYVAASVDRQAGLASVYLDGAFVSSVNIPAGTALFAPTGYEAPRMVFLTGVDDNTRPSYREPPTGYSIDAARVQRRTMDAFEIADNWIGLNDGVTIPLDCGGTCTAVVTATNRRPLVDECIRLSGANSTAQEGATLTKYEWRIGAGGVFEEGAATREISFDAPSPAAGVDVTLRVTDSSGCVASNTVNIVAVHPSPTAVLIPSLGAEVLTGNPIVLLKGDVLTLDGSTSRTTIPPTALLCPLIDAQPVPAPAIAEYRWDLDSNGSVDDTRDTFDIGPLQTAGNFRVTLTVVNEAGATGSAIANFRVIDVPNVEPGPPGRIFRATPETIGIWEFNDLDLNAGDALPTGLVIPDLSGNGLDATVEANDLAELSASDGDPRFGAENTAAMKSLPGVARVVVNEDDNAFEMGPDQSFSIELYVRRAPEVGTANWGILAGTWHSRTVTDDTADLVATGAWYGYGFIRDIDNGGWLLNCSPIQPDGTFTPGFNEIKTSPPFDIPAGSHYLVATVDRVTQRATVYLDGVSRAGVALPGGLAFITPPGYDHARMMFFAGEDDATRGAYREAPTGYGIDAARVLSRALTAQEVAQYYEHIRAGIAVPAPTIEAPDVRVDPASVAFGAVSTGSASTQAVTILNDGNVALDVTNISIEAGSSPAFSVVFDAFSVGPGESSSFDVTFSPAAVGPATGAVLIESNDPDEASVRVTLTGEGVEPSGASFIRGDANSDGAVNISDASFLLNFLFLGGPDPQCAATADGNADGGGNISDASFILNFLFLGGPDIPPPNACADEVKADPADCAAFPPCAGN